MSKVAVVYWSSTGNTESMANAVADGVICQEEPDDEAVENCKALGKALA